MSENRFVPSATERDVALTPETVESSLDAQEFSTTSVAGALPGALTVGQQLRTAREAMKMSAADAAKLLKLSTNQVVALEGDDWSRLPRTIIRGFIRNYARLLKLDPEPLMAELTALQMPNPPTLDLPAGTNTTLPESGRVERRDYAAVFSGLALVFVAVLAYFFVPQDFWQAKLMTLTAAGKPSAAIPEKTEPMVPVPGQSVLPLDATPATVVPAVPLEAGASPAVQQPAPTMPSGAPSSGLKLSFAQPSWVEIRDRSGEIIFSQLNPAGSQRDIEGQPPFSLVIGNATNVTVQYKGKLVDLSQRSKDDVARLSLD